MLPAASGSHRLREIPAMRLVVAVLVCLLGSMAGAAAQSVGRRTRNIADGLAAGQVGSFVLKR